MIHRALALRTPGLGDPGERSTSGGGSPLRRWAKRLVVFSGGRRVLATYGLVDPVPMRRDLLQGAGRGRCSFLQPGVHLFKMFEPLLECTDPQPEAADFLSDGLEVLSPRNDPLRSSRCQVSHRAGPATALRKKGGMEPMIRPERSASGPQP